MTCVYKEYEGKIKMVQEQWQQQFFSFSSLQILNITLRKFVKKNFNEQRGFLKRPYCDDILTKTETHFLNYASTKKW